MLATCVGSDSERTMYLFSGFMEKQREFVKGASKLSKITGTFFFSPHTFQDDVFAINYISIAFPMKQFSFKFILRVIV